MTRSIRNIFLAIAVSAAAVTAGAAYAEDQMKDSGDMMKEDTMGAGTMKDDTKSMDDMKSGTMTKGDMSDGKMTKDGMKSNDMKKMDDDKM